MTASAPATARRPGTARRASLFLIAVMTMLTAVQSWIGHQAEMAHADELVISVSKAVEQQISGSVRGIDNLLSAAAASIDPDLWPHRPQAGELASRLAAFPEVLYIGVVDSAGRLSAATIPGYQTEGEQIDVGNRAYFTEQRKNHREHRLYIGEPEIGQGSGARIIYMSRPISGPRDEFRGIVLAAVDSAYYARFLESVLIEKEGATAVIHANGVMLARAPDHIEKFGKWIGDSLLFTRDIPERPSGVGHFVARTDGNDKILGYRSLERYPLVVTSGITRDTALRNWRQQTYMSALILLAFSMALHVMATISDRREQRRQQALAELQERGRELEASALERTGDLASACRQAEQRAHRLARSYNELKLFAEAGARQLHEPLRPVIGYTQILERRYYGRLDEDGRDFIRSVLGGSLHMKRLLGDFEIYLALLDGGSTSEPTALGDCLKRAQTALAAEIEAGKAVLICEELPVVAGDSAQLDLLFRHLLRNAIQYRSPIRPPEIHVAAKREGGSWHVTVRDNGIGIEPHFLRNIFNVFERLNQGCMPKGTGIGLAICRKITEQHGGRIWADSQPGQGSRFHLTLPVLAAGDALPQARPEAVT